MLEPSTFHDLIRRVRAGDQDAAAELVRQYEPAIRRAVHFRLVDAGLRRLLDSTDICQAVFLSFFVRTASGQYELETPEQLQQLLVKMARNKLVNLAQQQHTERRDDRRLARRSIEQMSVVAPGSSASEQLAAKELLQETRRRLSGAARQVLELRERGRDWASIAVELGGSPEALRKAYTRALNRVAQQLGLDR